jgi:hypothetical protein
MGISSTDREARAEAGENEAALGLGDVQDAGRFRLDLRTGQWWWSDAVYEMHGFERGEVVPSTEVLVAHKHPDDRTQIDHVLREAQETGEPFSVVHRILDADGGIRTIAIVGRGRRDDPAEPATVTGVTGYFIDLTGAQERQAQDAASAAIQASAESRGLIEQAKGVVMAVHGVGPDDAFEVLRVASNHTNTRVREVAHRVVEAAGSAGRQLSAQALANALGAGAAS